MTKRTYSDRVRTVQEMIRSQQQIIRDLILPDDFERRVLKGIRNVSRICTDDLVKGVALGPKNENWNESVPRLWYSDGPRFGRVLTPCVEIDVVYLDDPDSVAKHFDTMVDDLRGELTKHKHKHKYLLEIGTHAKYEGFTLSVFAWLSGCFTDVKIKPPAIAAIEALHS